MEQDSKINPITGKPVEYSISPITGKPLIPKSTGLGIDVSMQIPTYKTQDKLESYLQYGTPQSALFNLDEERARRQSTAEKWRRGAAKGLITAFGSFAEGTIGIVDGLAEALIYKDSTKLFNHHIGRAIDDMNAWAVENMPNYYTEEEQKAKGLASLGYANFWADKGLNGLGYMLGTVASVYAGSGAMNLAGKGLKGASAALKGLNVAKAITSGKKVADILKATSSYGAQVAQAGKTATLGLVSAYAEASVEAREVLKQSEEEARARIAAMNGIDPKSLNAAQSEQARKEATDAANLAFALNIVTVGASNIILFGKLMGPKYFNLGKPKSIFPVDSKGMLSLPKTTVKDVAKTIGTGFVTEAFQEGTQFAIQEKALELADATDIENIDGAFGIPEMLESLIEGWDQTLQSKEGLDSVMVGALIGMLGGGAGSVRQAISNKQNEKAHAKMIEFLNNPQLFNFAQRAESIQAQHTILAELTQAYKNGDHKTVRDLQFKLIQEHAAMHLNAGSIDAFFSRLQDEEAKDFDTFASDWAIPESVTKNMSEGEKLQMKSDIVNGVKKKTEEFIERKKKIDAIAPDMAELTLVERLAMSKEQKEDYLLQKTVLNAYKKMLLDHSGTIADADSRIEKLRQELNDISDITITEDDIMPLVKQAKEEAKEESKKTEQLKTDADVFNKIKEEVDQNSEVRRELILKTQEELKQKIKEARAALKEKNPDKLSEFNEKQRDLLRLVEDRNKSVNALNNLYAPPKERAIYLEAALFEETAKVQEQYNKKFQEGVDATVTSKELGEFLQKEHPYISKKRIESAKAVQTARGVKEKAKQLELETNSLEELKSMDRSSMEAWELRVLDEIIQDMQDKGETKARREKPKPVASKREYKKRKKGSRGANVGNDTSDTVQRGLQGEGKKKSTRRSNRKTGPAKAKEKEITPGDRAIDYTVTRNRTDGQFKLQNGKVVVGKKGQEKQGDIVEYNLVNDTDPFIFGRELLRKGLIQPGTKVFFEVVETDYWKNGAAAAAEKNNNVAQSIPIFVFVNYDGKKVPIGNLRSGFGFARQGNSYEKVDKLSSLRQQVYEAYQSEEDVVIESTVKEVDTSNFFNAVTEDGDSYFYNPFEALGEEVSIGVVRLTKDGVRKIDLTPNENLSEEDVSTLNNAVSKAEEIGALANIAPGSVVFFHKEPNGSFQLTKGHTDTLSQSPIETVKDLIKEFSDPQRPVADIISDIESIVAINSIVYTNAELMRYFMAFDIIDGEVILGFKGLTEEGTSALDKYVGKDNVKRTTVIRVPAKVLADILNGKDLGDADTIFGEEERAAGYGLISETVNVEKDGKTFVNFKGITYEIELSNKKATDLIYNLPQFLENLLSRKRYNVDAERLSDPEYVNSLLQTNEESTNTGFTGRISTDSKLVDGSVFIDIGVNFEDAFTVDGKEFTNKIVKGQRIDQGPAKGRVIQRRKKAKPKTQQKEKEEEREEEEEETPKGKPSRTFGKKPKGEVEEQKPEGKPSRTFGRKPEGKVIVEDKHDPSNGKKEKNKKKKREATGKSATKKRLIDGANDIAFRTRSVSAEQKRINTAEAKRWLQERGIDVSVFSVMQTVGNATVHGYVEDSAVYLWEGAELGTEYHEAFHVVFRSMLSDAQRQGLYEEEANSYGEVTAQEIAAIKKQFPNMSEEEARNLAYEERMAERFRDYVLTEQELGKTLGGKIRRFFKNLWNYIKAIFSNGVGLRQLYSLIEGNNIPKKYSRTSQIFDGRAYRIVDGFENNIAVYKDLIEVGATQAIYEFNKRIERIRNSIEGNPREEKELVSTVLGDKETDARGVVAQFFFENSVYVKDENRSPISYKLQAEFAQLLKSKNTFENSDEFNAAIFKFLKDNNLDFGLPITNVDAGLLYKNVDNENNEDYMVLKDEEELHAIGKYFLKVYMEWFGKEDEFGNVRTGFREEVIKNIKPAGYNIKTEAIKVQDDNVDDVLQDDEHDEQDKYYFAESIEFNRQDKISGRLRQMIGGIVNVDRNGLGAQTFLNIDQAYRLLVAAVVDSRGLYDMMSKLEDRADIFPELKSLYNYLAYEATPEEVAGFRSFFSLGYSEQTYILEEAVSEEEDDDSDERTVVTKFGGADVKTAKRTVFQNWKSNANQSKVKKTNALYVLKYDDDGKFESRSINNDIVDGLNRVERMNNSVQKINSAMNYFNKGNNINQLSKGVTKLENSREFDQLVEGIALTAWNLGLEFGVNPSDAVNVIKSYLLNSVRKEDRLDRIKELRSSLFTLVKNNFEVMKTSDGKIISIENVKESPNDMFATETSSVIDLAEVMAMFRPPKATSHRDPTGKTIWAYTIRSQMSRLIDQMNDPDSELLNKLYAEDPFISGLPGFTEETTSELYRLLKSTPFELKSESINSVIPIGSGRTQSYKDMTIRNSLISRLNLYINNGSKDARYAVPTQETRGRLDTLTMPKWSNAKSMKRYGKPKTKEELIKSIVMRDLYRAFQDPKVRQKLDEGRYADIFILGKHVTNFTITKEMDERFQGLTIADVIGHLDESDTKIIAAIDEMVDNIVKNVLPSMRNDFIAELQSKNIAQLTDNAIEVTFPKGIRDKINEGTARVIQSRETDLHSTDNNPKPLRIGNKYYYARNTMINGAKTSFANFSKQVGGRAKALTFLGVENVEDANEGLQKFINGKIKLSLLTLQEVSEQEAQIEKELTLNRISESWNKQYANLEELVDAFVIDDLVARSEMIALFRGGIGQAKSLSDVFKRMGLLNTPGTEMMIAGEIARYKAEQHLSEQLGDETSELYQKIEVIRQNFEGKAREERIYEAKVEEYENYYDSLPEKDKEYGMLEFVRQAAVEKFELMEEIHDVKAEQYRAALIQDVNVSYTEEELDTIVDTYRRNLTTQARENSTDISDAFALISPMMARKLNEGQGKWEQTHQDAWSIFEESKYSVYVEDENGNLVVNQSNLGYSEPFKPSYSALVLRSVEKENPDGSTESNSVLRPELDKNAYFELRPELVAGRPLLEDLYNRMMAIGRYEGMEPIHVINTTSAKKGDKTGIVKLDQSAEFPAEALLDENVQIQKGENFILPQSISEKNDEYTRINRQIRKYQIAGIALDENYRLEDNSEMKGEDMFNLYNEAMYTLMKKKRDEVDEKLGVNLIRENDTVENRINFYKKIRQYIIEQKIERGELDDNLETQLEIIADGFRMPMHTTGYTQAYEGLLASIYKKEVMKITLPGKELVQAPGIGGMVKDEVTGQMRELRFLSVTEDENGQRIGHAEVLISSKLARRYGIKPGDDINKLPENLRRIIGYRIPHQGKSSTLIMKVVGFLPESHSKTIVVPGNITVQMGSDFDVDKLFVLMPEAEQIGETYQRVKEEYDINNIGNASIPQLRNTVFSIIESIASDIKHAGETLAPLDTKLLENIVSNVLQKNIDSEYFFGHPLIELEMEAKFKMSQRLVGVYANGMSGVSVAIFGKNNETRGTELHNSKHIEMVETDENGEERRVTLGTIQAVSPWTNKSVMYGMIKRLSAALDAGNTPLNDALNDNLITANAILYLESIGVDEESITLLMNNPLVKEFVEVKQNRNTSNYKTLTAMFEDGEMPNFYLKTKDNADSEFKKVLSRAALKRVYDMGEDGMQSKTAQTHFKIFLSALSAGDQLFNFYRSITPDVMDTMGDIATLEAYRDHQISAFQLGEKSIVSLDQIDQFIAGNAYKMQKGFMETQDHILSVLGELFMAPHDSVRTVKEMIKYFAGRNNLTGKEHKMIERAIAWYSMTKPVIRNGEDINPFSDILVKEKIERLFSTDNNLWTRLQKLLKKHELLRETKFLQMIEENEDNNSPFARLQRVQFSDMEKLDVNTRNEIIREINLMLNNPDFFVNEKAKQKKSEAKKIKRLAEDLILNTMISTGLAPGYGSYGQLIPIEFFMGLEKNGYTLRDHLMSEFKASKNNPNHFVKAIPTIFSNYGARKNEMGGMLVDGNFRQFVEMDFDTQKALYQDIEDSQLFGDEEVRAFLPKGYKFKENGKIALKKGKPSAPLIINIFNKRKKFDKTNLLILTKYGYVPVNPKGLTNQLIEMNIRDSAGRLTNENLISDRESIDLNFDSLDLLYNPGVEEVQEKLEFTTARRNLIYNKDC